MRTILVTILFGASLQTDYCNLNCGTIENTVCDRKHNCGPLKDCEQMDISNKFRRWILEAHNELRSRVALGKMSNLVQASNMRALSYDRNLEYVAQCHVNTCKTDRDACRRTKLFDDVGQNMYLGPVAHDESSVKEFVNSWKKELKNMDPELIDSFAETQQKGLESFTQLIWANTTHVGCARSHDRENHMNNHIFACNYGPSGNIKGQPIYQKGKPCTSCGDMECNIQYAGLCGESVIQAALPLAYPSAIIVFLVTSIVLLLK